MFSKVMQIGLCIPYCYDAVLKNKINKACRVS